MKDGSNFETYLLIYLIETYRLCWYLEAWIVSFAVRFLLLFVLLLQITINALRKLKWNYFLVTFWKKRIKCQLHYLIETRSLVCYILSMFGLEFVKWVPLLQLNWTCNFGVHTSFSLLGFEIQIRIYIFRSRFSEIYVFIPDRQRLGAPCARKKLFWFWFSAYFV